MDIFFIINIVIGVFAYYLGKALINKEKILYVIIMTMAIFSFWISKDINTISVKEILVSSASSTIQVVILILLILKKDKKSDSCI